MGDNSVRTQNQRCHQLVLFTGDSTFFTGVIPISLFLLATGTVLRKAAIDRGVRLATGRYGCRQINKPSNSTVSVLI